MECPLMVMMNCYPLSVFTVGLSSVMLMASVILQSTWCFALFTISAVAKYAPWDAHFATAHRDGPTLNVPFTAEIVHGVKDHVDHKMMEAIKITVNTDRGWQPLPTIIGVSCDFPTH